MRLDAAIATAAAALAKATDALAMAQSQIDGDAKLRQREIDALKEEYRAEKYAEIVTLREQVAELKTDRSDSWSARHEAICGLRHALGAEIDATKDEIDATA